MTEYIRKRVHPATVTLKNSPLTTTTTATTTTSPFSLSSTRRSASANQYKSSSSINHDSEDYNSYDRSPTAKSKKFDSDDHGNIRNSNINSNDYDFDEFDSFSPNGSRKDQLMAATKDEYEYTFPSASSSTSQKKRTSDSAPSEDGTIMEMAATAAFNVTAAAAAALTAPLHVALQPHNSNINEVPRQTAPYIAATKASTDAYLSSNATTASMAKMSSGIQEHHPLIHLEIDKPPVSALHGGNPISRIINVLINKPVSYLYGQWALLSTWIGQSSLRCWTVLLVAILIEIYATTLMKIAVDASEEIASGTATKSTRNPTKCTFLSLFTYVISLGMFGVSLQKIDVGIAYAIWSAVGTATVAVAGMLWFGEPYTTGKVFSLLLIVLGVVGLNLAEDH